MKYSLFLLLIFCLNTTSLQASIELPQSVIESYSRLKSGQSINAEEDWEQLVAFMIQNKVPMLVPAEELLRLNNRSMMFLSASTKLILMKWLYEQQLFQLDNWLKTEDRLVAIAAYASDNKNAEFSRWALSRIALLMWLNGESDYAKAYVQFSDESEADAEVWFTYFKEAVNECNGPYKWLEGYRIKSGVQEALNYLSLPTGEWLSLAVMLEKWVYNKEEEVDLQKLFTQIDRIFPASEFEALAPYLVQIAQTKGWDLNSIYLTESPSLEQSKQWLVNYQILKEEWNLGLDRIQQQAASPKKTDLFAQIPIPKEWLMGIGGIIAILSLILITRRLNADTLAEDAKPEFSEEIESSKNTNQRKDLSNVLYEAPPKLIEESIYEHPKDDIKDRLPTNGLMNVESANSNQKKDENAVKKLEPLSIGGNDTSDDELNERIERFKKTIDEATEQASFVELWAMIERFILKEFPYWFNTIDQSSYEFTDREKQYISLFFLEFDQEQICKIAQIKTSSIRSIRSRIRKKMGVSSDVEPHKLLLNEMK